MESNIDKLSLKLTRIYPIDVAKTMELGEDVQVLVKGSVVEQIVGDNQDGTVNVCYVVKPTVVEVLNDEARSNL